MGTLSPDLVTMSQISAEQKPPPAGEMRVRERDALTPLPKKGFWRAPEAIPESLDAKIDGNAPAGQQLDALEGWLDRQKDHDAGDWPEAGDFTGGKHDRHASADDFQA